MIELTSDKFIKNLNGTGSDSKSKVAMARKKGALQVSPERKKCVYDMRMVGMRVAYIADYYKMSRSTICNIVKRYKDDKYKKISKKLGRKFKSSPRSLHMSRNYVILNCFEPLFVIGTKFECDTGITMSVSTGKK